LISFNSHQYRIYEELPLYVKLGYRESVFKMTHFRQNQTQSSIHFSFPDLIKTQELRFHPRHVFRPAQDKFVILRSSVLKDTSSELKVRAMDVSETGLGLVISEQNRNFLKNNRILWITGLQDENLEAPVLAEVVYMSSEVDPKFIMKKQKSLKVGIQLSGYFPQDVYQQFLK